MNMNPYVTIVIVTWNKKEDVLNLLNALQNLDYDNFQIVLVDNASTDNTVAEVLAHPLELTLLENSKNLGGTGGFNTGLRYVMSNLEQDYVWLLDNDAMVTQETLKHLVNAMEFDLSIGVAGSRIMAPERTGLIVELGGTVSWNDAIWDPNRRYQLENNEDEGTVVEVDYVAACSALLRDSALRHVGIMDERFFLHWDDVDFCLRFKQEGFKVVGVYDSVIYHSVEKGFNPNIVYFDVRNGLLMAAKHLSLLKRLPMQWALSRLVGVGWISSVIDKRKRLSLTFLRAFKDALTGNYGGFKPPPSDLPRIYNTTDLPANPARVLLIANGPYQKIGQVFDVVKNHWPNCEIDLFVQSDRVNLLEPVCSQKSMLCFDLRRDSFFMKIRTALRLMASRYDLAVEVSDDFFFPYSVFLKKIVIVNDDGSLVCKRSGFLDFIKLASIMFLGFILTVLIFPFSVLQGVFCERKV